MSLAAENGCVCVDNAIVSDIGVALDSLDGITVLTDLKALCTEGNTLIYLDVVADSGGLTDNDTGAMVDEEIFADGGAGMDVDAGDGVGVFGHDPGQHGNTQSIQDMRQTVNGDGKQTRISKDNFCYAGGCRVSVIGGLEISVSLSAAHSLASAFRNESRASISVFPTSPSSFQSVPA